MLSGIHLLSFNRIGSLIIDFQVTYTNAHKETLKELKQVFFNALNASFPGDVLQLQLTG